MIIKIIILMSGTILNLYETDSEIEGYYGD